MQLRSAGRRVQSRIRPGLRKGGPSRRSRLAGRAKAVRSRAKPLRSASRLGRESPHLGGAQIGLGRAREQGQNGSGTKDQQGRRSGLARERVARVRLAKASGRAGRLRGSPLETGLAAAVRMEQSRHLASRSRASLRKAAALETGQGPDLLATSRVVGSARGPQTEASETSRLGGVFLISPRVGAALARSQRGRSPESGLKVDLGGRLAEARDRSSSGSSSRGSRLRAKLMSR